MLASNEWETLGDISRRTGVRGEEVIEIVRQELRSGLANLRIVDDSGVTITQIQKRQEETI
jgi:uncharacterized protein YnzC (UPF0291/DUF896 family)